MTARPTIPSFRQLNALVLHPDDHDRSVLERNLRRLGLLVHSCSIMPDALVLSRANVIFFDVDTGCDGQFDRAPADVPRIALVGSEAPGRLEWMLAQDPEAWLMKPIRSGGLYTALAIAFRQEKQRRDAARRMQRLQARAHGRSAVEAAVALLMRRHGCSEPEAFARLRRAAMDRRLGLHVYATMVVADRDAAEVPRGLAAT